MWDFHYLYHWIVRFCWIDATLRTLKTGVGRFLSIFEDRDSSEFSNLHQAVRFRLTIGNLLGVVALIAIALWFMIGTYQRTKYEGLASRHAVLATIAGNEVVHLQKMIQRKQIYIDQINAKLDLQTNGDRCLWLMNDIQSLEDYLLNIEKVVNSYQINVSFHEQMRAKYESATRYPWKQVLPDPPEPILSPLPGAWFPPG